MSEAMTPATPAPKCALRQTAPRFICTPSHPWPKGGPTPVVHPAGREISNRDGYPGGDIVTMQCTVCGHEWEQELSQ